MSLQKATDLNLPTKLQNKEYRYVFFDEWAIAEVANQIRWLRKLRQLRQSDLAIGTGMKPSAISRIEQSDYARWNFLTLLRIGQALDARVRVIFEPAEDVIRNYESEKKGVLPGAPAETTLEVKALENQTSTTTIWSGN